MGYNYVLLRKRCLFGAKEATRKEDFMANDKTPFFITTPIYYVNAAPHLGTAYCTILCDVQARFRRAMGQDVKFLTGLDEHGEKVQRAAEEHGMTPQAWCDSLAPAFHDIWKTLEISNDDFIRTTQPRQIRAVQHLWDRMKEAGYIYKDSYDGWYCVHEETYYTETQVTKSDEEHGVEGRHLCPECQRELQRVKEESWFFKLSAFQDRLLKLYDEHPDFVMPAFRMNEVRSFVESGLRDISVSRTSFDWGIPVPFDDKHVTYVWFDALLNYATAVGFGDPDMADEYARRWPAQYHVVGKDIIRFHCVIWPAMLMAIGEALPEHVFAHGSNDPLKELCKNHEYVHVPHQLFVVVLAIISHAQHAYSRASQMASKWPNEAWTQEKTSVNASIVGVTKTLPPSVPTAKQTNGCPASSFRTFVRIWRRIFDVVAASVDGVPAKFVHVRTGYAMWGFTCPDYSGGGV